MPLAGKTKAHHRGSELQERKGTICMGGTEGTDYPLDLGDGLYLVQLAFSLQSYLGRNRTLALMILGSSLGSVYRAHRSSLLMLPEGYLLTQ